MERPTFLIIADGAFGPETSKTANSAIRYFPERVLAVFDRTAAGRTAQDILGFGGAIPVVGSFAEGLALGPQSVLIGIAPAGGRLPPEWRGWLLEAIDRGIHVWSGLHSHLHDDAELVARAEAKGVTITDARRPPADLPVSNGLAQDVDAFVVLSVGSDCNVGKMTAQLQLVDGLNRRGIRTRFAATGQTGILIEGWGIAVDAVVADFIGGAAEQLVLEAAKGADVVLVEGQGSLIHPAYAGVTLGLMHGAMPAAMIMCHQASREFIGDYSPGREAWVRIPKLSLLNRIYLDAMRPLRESAFLGVALNTYDLADAEARAAIRETERDTGLPVTDPVRYGPEPLIEAVTAGYRAWKSSR